VLFVDGRAIAVPGDMSFVSSPIVQQVIGCAINVHREVGPGLFERVYQKCFAYELSRSGLRFVEQVPLKLAYQNVVIPCLRHGLLLNFNAPTLAEGLRSFVR